VPAAIPATLETAIPILRAICALSSGLFIIAYGMFAVFIWNESIAMMRALHALYVGIVLISAVYGFVGRRPLVGLTVNLATLFVPVVILLGSI
jgi:hypothetical protein